MPLTGAEILPRRSMLHRWHRDNGAEFEVFGDAAFVSRYGPEPQERLAATRLGLCDLSLMPRLGVSGAGAGGWLKAQGLSLPGKPNQATPQKGGNVLARLSEDEYLLLGTQLLEGGNVEPPLPICADQPDARVYALPRLDSHGCFAVSGEHAAGLFSKLCAVDLRAQAFANGDVAQTSLAHSAAIILRRDLRACLCYLLLVNSVAAEYVFEALLHAMEEYNGAPVGLLALLPGKNQA